MNSFLLGLFFATLCLAGNLEQPNYACSLSGDPHFKSLDGINFDFQGIGWFDLIKHPNLRISAEFVGCGGANKVSCMRNLVIWSDTCKTDACQQVTITLKDNKAYYQLGAAAAHELSAYYSTLQVIPTTVSTSVKWSGNTLTATGCVAHCLLTWTVTAHTGYVVVVLNNPPGSLEVNWGGLYGICGTPNGNKEDEYSLSTGTSLAYTTASTTSWHNIVTEIRTWGMQLDSSQDPVSQAKVQAAINGATGTTYTVAAGTAQTVYSTAEVDGISTCSAAYWVVKAGFATPVEMCQNEAAPACAAEAAAGTPAYKQCMLDFYVAYKNAADHAAFTTDAKGWTDERLVAASIYNSAIAVDESVMLGLFIGLGVGLVFVVAAVAFFAKNPELLPFTHKKKKVMKELAATDVLK